MELESVLGAFLYLCFGYIPFVLLRTKNENFARRYKCQCAAYPY